MTVAAAWAGSLLSLSQEDGVADLLPLQGGRDRHGAVASNLLVVASSCPNEANIHLCARAPTDRCKEVPAPTPASQTWHAHMAGTGCARQTGGTRKQNMLGKRQAGHFGAAVHALPINYQSISVT